jgi:spermidine/putrescine-binding protein
MTIISPGFTTTRRLLLSGAAATGAGFGGGRALAQDVTVSAVMPGVFIPNAARPILEGMARAHVQNAAYLSPTDTLAKLLAPGGTSRYDLMISVTQFISKPAMGPSAAAGKVMPLNMDLIPNAKSIMSLAAPDIIQRDGKTYMVPLVLGYDSVVFDKSRLPDEAETNTWGILFNEKYAGKLAWRDDAMSMYNAAALTLGHKTPVLMTASDIDEVTKFLTAKKKLIRTMWTQFGEAVNLISSGEVYAMYGWIPMLDALQKQGIKAENNWPKEGVLIWTQGALIPKDAPNAEATHRVINAFLSREYGEKLVQETRYTTTSSEVAALFSPAEQHRLNLDIATRGIATCQLQWPDQMDQWVEGWNTVKSA